MIAQLPRETEDAPASQIPAKGLVPLIKVSSAGQGRLRRGEERLGPPGDENGTVYASLASSTRVPHYIAN